MFYNCNNLIFGMSALQMFTRNNFSFRLPFLSFGNNFMTCNLSGEVSDDYSESVSTEPRYIGGPIWNFSQAPNIDTFNFSNPSCGFYNSGFFSCPNIQISSQKPAATPTKKVSKSENEEKNVSFQKIDVSKKVNLGDDGVYRQIVNGTYDAQYVNIAGHIHYSYDECASSDLVPITITKKCDFNSGASLRKDANDALDEMINEAKKAGITLLKRSGYRSKNCQINLFRGQDSSADGLTRHASSSAVSGYSEHHTGLAIDLADSNGNFIQAGSKEDEWLRANAEKFGFEQSFPKGNAQNLDEEAWHYRFVGKNHENDYIFKSAIANDPAMLGKRQK